MSKVVSKNVRGPFPAGQCFQFVRCDNTVLEEFYCYNDPWVAVPEDSISAYRSSNVVIRDGVVQGSNAPTGICVMFEGSEHGVSNGTISNVEAYQCMGCFSGYPIAGLY